MRLPGYKVAFFLLLLALVLMVLSDGIRPP